MHCVASREDFVFSRFGCDTFESMPTTSKVQKVLCMQYLCARNVSFRDVVCCLQRWFVVNLEPAAKLCTSSQSGRTFQDQNYAVALKNCQAGIGILPEVCLPMRSNSARTLCVLNDTFFFFFVLRDVWQTRM